MKTTLRTVLAFFISMACLCCTATQRQVAATAAIGTGIDALDGANNQQLELDGAKAALKVIHTP